MPRPPSPPLLDAHLASWLGAWPPTADLVVVGSPRREQPGWDGHTHPALGVSDSGRATVLSVPPAAEARVRAAGESASRTDLLERLPALLGLSGHRAYEGVFRWSTSPAALPDVGAWVPADAPGVPEWLRPFGGDVLVATDPDGVHLAGVGLKRHDPYGHELAVGTTPAARGRGLARALVAQAARRVLALGAVPTYQHDPANAASARVAEAAGFPDRGWRSIGVFAVSSP